ncbi:concanavalin A-like lectin/glucanase domain-containing protein [Xylariomycetidae sp. FL2044]|nr:concanavalin A-like lectin/glucanase domain-containing protein [Xylariomycetidae sp. FL2044]
MIPLNDLQPGQTATTTTQTQPVSHFGEQERHRSSPAARNPFDTPPFGTPIPSIRSRGRRSAAISVQEDRPRRRFQSSRLVGELEKPWLDKSNKTVNWDSIIFYSCVILALLISGYICWASIKDVPKHDYCLIMDDEFANLDNWGHEVQMNGFGTGSFDWTTTDETNSYVDQDGLHIVPTLTTETTSITVDQLMNGYTVNLTTDGTCTATDQRTSNLTLNDACSTVSNSTKGVIINPVRSARLTTAGKKTIRYGRVEVVAKLPAGDWLWPAIWMMPQDSVYGEWPNSGEIDICESRGNDGETYGLGNNIVSSAMHWGTSYTNDAYRLSKGEWGSKRTKYSDDYHTYGLEWSEKYMFTWLDGRLRQVVYFDFTKNKNMWTYGDFADITGAGPDPWSSTGQDNTPFDQDFYLILNVAVGSTNGWFPDGMGNKPWTDGSTTAMKEFYAASDSWLPTWGAPESRGMTVKSVKMWQEGTC